MASDTAEKQAKIKVKGKVRFLKEGEETINIFADPERKNSVTCITVAFRTDIEPIRFAD